MLLDTNEMKQYRNVTLFYRFHPALEVEESGVWCQERLAWGIEHGA